MKPLLTILFTLSLATTQAFAANLTGEQIQQILQEAAEHPEYANDLALEFPDLSNQIMASAQSNPNNKRIRSRTAIYPEKFKKEIAKGREWRENTGLEVYHPNEFTLGDESESPWRQKGLTEITQFNEFTVNRAQTIANATESARQQGIISYQEAQRRLNLIAATGSQFVNPLPVSGR